MEEAEPTDDQDEFEQSNHNAMDAASLEFVAAAIQHHVWPVTGRLTVPESAFVIIRKHINSHSERNFPGAEGAMTALALALQELDRALDAVAGERGRRSRCVVQDAARSVLRRPDGSRVPRFDYAVRLSSGG